MLSPAPEETAGSEREFLHWYEQTTQVVWDCSLVVNSPLCLVWQPWTPLEVSAEGQVGREGVRSSTRPWHEIPQEHSHCAVIQTQKPATNAMS